MITIFTINPYDDISEIEKSSSFFKLNNLMPAKCFRCKTCIKWYCNIN